MTIDAGLKAEKRSGHLTALLLVAAILLVAWSLAVPIFEGPDEQHHWAVARYMHEKKRLPVFDKELIEANSPPLYYVLIAPLASATDPPAVFVDQDGKAMPFGVHVVLGRGEPALRMFQNDRSDFGKYWPIRAARLLSVVMSVLGVWFTYLAGREATGRCANLYARLCCGVPARDLTAGFVGYRTDLLRTLPIQSVRSEGYSFLIEMKYLVHRAGAPIKEVPITFVERREGKSKLSSRVAIEAVQFTTRTLLQRIFGGGKVSPPEKRP